MKFAVFSSGAKPLSDAEKLSGFPDSWGGGVAVRGAESEKEPGVTLNCQLSWSSVVACTSLENVSIDQDQVWC